ncbi:hypothetical protein [Halomonas sp.]|jgi:membrane-associated PAP2 superfamily phosphatase|uniref:hypothetical protein n=1 Tax=Halomonas sp. TaxID=1486246 RepID=UPI0035620BA8
MPDLHPLATTRPGEKPALLAARLRPLQRLALAWCGFIVLMLVEHWLALDFRLADALYGLQGGEWVLPRRRQTERLPTTRFFTLETPTDA